VRLVLATSAAKAPSSKAVAPKSEMISRAESCVSPISLRNHKVSGTSPVPTSERNDLRRGFILRPFSLIHLHIPILSPLYPVVLPLVARDLSIHLRRAALTGRKRLPSSSKSVRSRPEPGQSGLLAPRESPAAVPGAAAESAGTCRPLPVRGIQIT